MKALFDKFVAWLKSLKWAIMYPIFALVVYLHIGGFFGAVAATAVIYIINHFVRKIE